MSELLSFRGGRNPMVKAEWARTREDKGKRAALPDIPSERSGSSLLFFAVQRRKARREGEGSVRYLKRRYVKRDRVRVLLVQRQRTPGFDGGSDRENNVQTKLERRQEIAIACDRKLARASDRARLSALINPDRQNSALTP